MRADHSDGLVRLFRPASPVCFSRKVEFSSEERAKIQAALRLPLHPDRILFRQGPGNSKIAYVDQHQVIQTANALFGFDGWAMEVRALTKDFLSMRSSGRIDAGYSAIIRVTLKNGCFREDIGYGEAVNAPRDSGLEKAKKQACTDGLKRALKTFGSCTGQCLNDKDYCRYLAKRNAKRLPANYDQFFDPNDPNALRQLAPDTPARSSVNEASFCDSERGSAKRPKPMVVSSPTIQTKTPSPRTTPKTNPGKSPSKSAHTSPDPQDESTKGNVIGEDVAGDEDWDDVLSNMDI
ncbi:uncharacterized protein MONBRDRAFT_26771 [Monosiga brevicollis MX1]|uniref:DNA repair and recombination protein RAD52 n=1 Tax=Monosiga brevicollis TaxID=81824 RepID=A9V3B8_MONBE|nr:uncharacterized protein MONBRDRAFT_26771 [Monosiga brevicollis MX1]EDQ88033.1 predicted protein [Monosiga brevicollis MX1]|eukprot:XP_001747109.1 hypothetical protein [Monosiga brevicollis MX1]